MIINTTHCYNYSLGCVLLLLTGLMLGACGWQVGKSAYHETAYASKGRKDIIVNIGLEPESLDPQLTTGVAEVLILKTLFEGLVSVDSKGNVVPALASSWEQQGYTVWTFHLRKNAHWSDGTPITAHDFVYAWRRVLAPETASLVVSALTDVWVLNAKQIMLGKKPISELGVKALDDYTFQVVLEKPVPFFLITLDSPALYALPRKSIETYGKKWTRPKNMLTSGPYYLKSWHINSDIQVVRNPYYWNNAETRNEKVTFLPIVSTISDTINYMSGNEDMTSNSVPPELFKKIKQAYPNELKIAPLACNYYYDMNMRKPPFNDKRVRLALSLTLPRDIIVNKVIGQGQEVSYTKTPYFLKHFTKIEPEWVKWDENKKVAYARELLNQAGYNEKHPLKFEILYNTQVSHKTIAVTVASEWTKKLGFVQVSLNNMEWKTYLDAMRLGNFDMIRRGSCASYNDPATFILSHLSDSPDNYSGYSNPAYDKLVQEMFGVNIDDKSIQERYIRAEKILLQDAASLVIYSYVQPRLVKTYLKGFEMSPLGDIKFPKLWLDDGEQILKGGS